MPSGSVSSCTEVVVFSLLFSTLLFCDWNYSHRKFLSCSVLLISHWQFQTIKKCPNLQGDKTCCCENNELLVWKNIFINKCHINYLILDYLSFLGYDIFMNAIESQHSKSEVIGMLLRRQSTAQKRIVFEYKQKKFPICFSSSLWSVHHWVQNFLRRVFCEIVSDFSNHFVAGKNSKRQM